MRIIGGAWRGKKLLEFNGDEIRPTSDRIKETIFNMISTKKFGSRILHNAIILDCFAGTGALSMESLSRGAKFAHIWDNSQKSIELIMQNLQDVEKNLYKTLKISAYHPPKAQESANIIFIDPPYAEIKATTGLLFSLEENSWIDANSLIIIESSVLNQPTLPNNYNLLETKIMGRTAVTFARIKG